MTRFDAYCWQLREALQRSGRDRDELARALGLRPGTLKSWITGRRSPTVRRLLDLAALIDIDPRELFEEPVDVPDRTRCPACGRTFREVRFYRIHVGLRAKDCPDHARLGSPVPQQEHAQQVG